MRNKYLFVLLIYFLCLEMQAQKGPIVAVTLDESTRLFSPNTGGHLFLMDTMLYITPQKIPPILFLDSVHFKNIIINLNDANHTEKEKFGRIKLVMENGEEYNILISIFHRKKFRSKIDSIIAASPPKTIISEKIKPPYDLFDGIVKQKLTANGSLVVQSISVQYGYSFNSEGLSFYPLQYEKYLNPIEISYENISKVKLNKRKTVLYIDNGKSFTFKFIDEDNTFSEKSYKYLPELLQK